MVMVRIGWQIGLRQVPVRRDLVCALMARPPSASIPAEPYLLAIVCSEVDEEPEAGMERVAQISARDAPMLTSRLMLRSKYQKDEL